jgi:hypothetical protein
VHHGCSVPQLTKAFRKLESELRGRKKGRKAGKKRLRESGAEGES